ncbi:MAG: M56 family metallopeptidase [Thermoanaerobaculia bacterium]|nr:M56 family metallopeptidase [Thermoanaerobaculia bacterium]
MTDFLFEVATVSAKATLVVAVVVAAQLLLRSWLPAGFRHALWALVALRLLLPSLPESPVSVQQTARPATALPGLAQWLPDAEAPPVAGTDLVAAASFDLSLWLASVWLLVTAVLLVRRGIGSARLASLLRRARPVTHPQAQALLDSCRSALGVSRSLRLLESSEIHGPAACGVLRPAVLVPEDIFVQLSPRQQRHALLHEVAHLKRLDAGSLNLAHFLVAVHWFNPFLWLALRRFESDLEMACDATVLAHLETAERASYGKTLLEVGVRPLAAAGSPCFAVDSQRQLTRRIRMITRFKPRSWNRTFSLLALAAMLVVVTLTEIPTTLAAGPVDASLLAQKISSKLDSGTRVSELAAELAELLEGADSDDSVLFALRAEAERLELGGRHDHARRMRGLADLLERRAGDESANPQAWAESKQTVSIVRNAGTAMYHHLFVPVFGEDPPKETVELRLHDFRWQDCPAIDYEELQEMLGSALELSKTDGWGHELEYCLKIDPEQLPALIGVRSAGRDGSFDGESYSTGRFYISDVDRDIVWTNGFFIRWPEP